MTANAPQADGILSSDVLYELYDRWAERGAPSAAGTPTAVPLPGPRCIQRVKRRCSPRSSVSEVVSQSHWRLCAVSRQCQGLAGGRVFAGWLMAYSGFRTAALRQGRLRTAAR
jgi:hypothetical protein